MDLNSPLLVSRKACKTLVKPNSDTDSMNNVDGDAIVVNTDGYDDQDDDNNGNDNNGNDSMNNVDGDVVNTDVYAFKEKF